MGDGSVVAAEASERDGEEIWTWQKVYAESYSSPQRLEYSMPNYYNGNPLTG